MDLNQLAQHFLDENALSVDIVVYKMRDGTDVIRETITIDYCGEDDYQWTRTTKPIYTE